MHVCECVRSYEAVSVASPFGISKGIFAKYNDSDMITGERVQFDALGA